MARSSEAAEEPAGLQLESTTLYEDSVVNTAIETFSCTEVQDVGPSSSTPYVSARIQGMIQFRSECENELECKIESSKHHWSELSRTSSTEQAAETNLEIFESLRKHPQYEGFFKQTFKNLVVGRKIAEGAQAEIFEAEWRYGRKYVVKVFKDGYSVRDLQRQWPLGMTTSKGDFNFFYSCWVYGGTVLENDRFAFVMEKSWGDLRTLMDQRMLLTNNRRPPFSIHQVTDILSQIAQAMGCLHEDGILHGDLKTSNVLVRVRKEDDNPILYGDDHLVSVRVADFECSVGVVGTGFWRAPEILQALSVRNNNPEFTSKADVYSYAMTCYELLTGCLPFEECCPSDYNLVLSGHRPRLPNYTPTWLANLIHRCWHLDPLKRPTFQEIFEKIYRCE